MKLLTLYNYKYHSYAGDPDSYVITDIDLENLDDIATILIKVISGDEIATIVYTNGKIETFDSCGEDIRTTDYFDGEYFLYTKNGVNYIDEFLKRKDSYDFFHKYEEFEEE